MHLIKKTDGQPSLSLLRPVSMPLNLFAYMNKIHLSIELCKYRFTSSVDDWHVFDSTMTNDLSGVKKLLDPLRLNETVTVY